MKPKAAHSKNPWQDLGMKLFRVVRSTLFLGVLCVSLLTSVAGLAVHAISVTEKLAKTTAAMASAAKAHRLDKAKAVSRARAKEKAKARIRRWVVAGSAMLPVAGMVAGPTVAGYFEVADFNDWKTDNPEGDFGEYACETGDLSAELIDEALRELPGTIRPDADRVLSWMPECGASLEEQHWKSTDPPPN